MDFEQFLGKMSNQTGANLQVPSSESIMQKHLVEQAPPPVAPKPIPADPTPPRSAPRQNEPEELNEDIVERVYEATSAILKSLRQAFPNKNERMMVFESIQNAINMALNDGSPSRPAPIRQPAQPPVKNNPPASRPARGQMIEDGEFIIPRPNMALEGVEYNPGGDGYSRKIDIQPGQGLTDVSEQDIADLKTLAGI